MTTKKKKKCWKNLLGSVQETMFGLRHFTKPFHPRRCIMRKTMGLLVAGILVLGGASVIRSGEEGDGRALVDKAIKAAGGPENLSKHNSATFKEKGIYYGEGKGQPYTGIYSFQWPDKFRMEI